MAAQRTIRFRRDAVCLFPAVAGGVPGAIVGAIVAAKYSRARASLAANSMARLMIVAHRI
jgi:hypothetical protein